ncbi:MAG: hypothetical protein QOH71_1259 [Blastocatellia bacterium]|nr:hypothetical protein [Blastocatellia bacterium]
MKEISLEFNLQVVVHEVSTTRVSGWIEETQARQVSVWPTCSRKLVLTSRATLRSGLSRELFAPN